MKNYVLIFHSGGPTPETPEFFESWGPWYGMIGEKLIDGGNPFNGSQEAQVKMGEVTMKADTASGYTIVKAENLEEAIGFAKACPMAKLENAWVNVYETMSM